MSYAALKSFDFVGSVVLDAPFRNGRIAYGHIIAADFDCGVAERRGRRSLRDEGALLNSL